MLNKNRSLFSSFLCLTVLLAGCGSQATKETSPAAETSMKKAAAEKQAAENTVYVVNKGANSLQIINTENNTVTATVSIGDEPSYNQISPDGKYVYTTNSKSNNISIVDIATQKVIKTIQVGKAPKGVNFTPDGKSAYVINEGAGTVSVVDVKTMETTAVIQAGKFPHNSVASPDSKKMYVTNTGSDSISVIDTVTHKIIQTIEGVGELPHNLTISPNGKTIFVTLTKSNAIGVIDVDKGKMTQKIPVGKGHHVIDLTPDARYAYVGNIGEDTVSVIDVNNKKTVHTIRVGQGPHGVAITPDGKKALVAATKENKIIVIDTSNYQIINSIETEKTPFFIVTLGSHGLLKPLAASGSKPAQHSSHSEASPAHTNFSTQTSEQEDDPSSPLLTSGDQWNYTFTKLGRYKVVCDLHPGMDMTVTVEAKQTAVKNKRIELKQEAFMPDKLTVPEGTTVTWKNLDSDTHNVAVRKN